MSAAGAAEWLGKAAILGALSLYINFINMFMFLLQFLGHPVSTPMRGATRGP